MLNLFVHHANSRLLTVYETMALNESTGVAISSFKPVII
jgi:hypothetical protein